MLDLSPRFIRLRPRPLDLGLICPLPPGITPDNSAIFSLYRLMANVNNYSLSLTAPINAGAGFTISAPQFNQGIINVTAASGGFNATLPTTAQLLAAMGSTIPLDGTYSEPFHFMNNGSGQTASLVAGDTNTTVTGNNTMLTNTYREFLMTVNAAVAGVITITVQNLGTRAL